MCLIILKFQKLRKWLLSKMTRYSSFILLSVFTAVGLALRIFHIDFQSLWVDELLVILKAEQKSLWEIVEASKVDVHPPLYDYLIHFWIYFGKTVWILRFFSLIFGVASIPLIYWIGKKFYGEKVGLTAAFILTIWPFSIWYSQEIRPYTLIFFFGLLAIGFFLKGLETNSLKYWSSFIIVIILCLYTHHSTLYLILVFNIFMAISWLNKKYLDIAYRWIGVQFIIILLYLPGLYILVSQLLWQKNSGTPGLVFLKQPGLSTIPYLFYNLTFYADALPLGGLRGFMLIPVVIILFSGLKPSKESFKGIRTFIANEKTLFLILSLFLPVIICFVLGSLVKKEFMYESRFFMIFMPAYLIILARGFLQIKHKSKKVILIAFFLLSIFAANYRIYTVPINPPIKEVVKYIKARYLPGDIVLFHGSIWKIVFDYYSQNSMETEGVLHNYTPKKGVFPYQFEKVSESYVPVFQEKLKNYSRAWIVLTPPKIRRDPKQIVIKYLDKHFENILKEKIFPEYFEIWMYDLNSKKQV